MVYSDPPEIWVVYGKDDYERPHCIAIYLDELQALRYLNNHHGYGKVAKLDSGDFTAQIEAIWEREGAEWEAERLRNREKAARVK